MAPPATAPSSMPRSVENPPDFAFQTANSTRSTSRRGMRRDSVTDCLLSPNCARTKTVSLEKRSTVMRCSLKPCACQVTRSSRDGVSTESTVCAPTPAGTAAPTSRSVARTTALKHHLRWRRIPVQRSEPNVRAAEGSSSIVPEHSLRTHGADPGARIRRRELNLQLRGVQAGGVMSRAARRPRSHSQAPAKRRRSPRRRALDGIAYKLGCRSARP